MSSRARRWFVESGIQESSGGVARYYRTDSERNLPVSTEITGYAASALLGLKEREAASRAAHFLVSTWDGTTMPFETQDSGDGLFAYFFDCGIIVRGLLSVWRASGAPELLDVAAAIGESMARDFSACDGTWHPILRLPSKQPIERDALRWSRFPGCYQLKAAMAWQELFEATGERRFAEHYERTLETELRGYGGFLPGHPDPLKVMDRLHAGLYFLEGLLPRATDPRCIAALCNGLERVGYYLNTIAAEFERSDVYAQLLRIRIFADWAGAVPLDQSAAAQEASTLAGFQIASTDPRTDGGFYFGRKAAEWMPCVNPVSTAFGAQALELWGRYRAGGAPMPWNQLV